MVNAGIPVCAHIGLTPQSATALSGYKVQGRTAEAATKLLHDAVALEEAQGVVKDQHLSVACRSAAYADEVRSGAFPDAAHSFSMNEEQLQKIYGDVQS